MFFFSLTKNPERFREFAGDRWPRNWLVGISVPPTYMFGKKLSPAQQATMLRKWLEFLCESPAQSRWISIEPLSFDVSEIIRPFADQLHWAVVGAASNGGALYQPHFGDLAAVQRVLKCPVFFKGNLDRGLAHAVAIATTLRYKWRQEFPIIKP